MSLLVKGKMQFPRPFSTALKTPSALRLFFMCATETETETETEPIPSHANPFSSSGSLAACEIMINVHKIAPRRMLLLVTVSVALLPAVQLGSVRSVIKNRPNCQAARTGQCSPLPTLPPV